LAQLQHSHILQVFDIADYKGSLYFTMELAENGSLGRCLKQGPMPPRQAAAMMVELARAVQAAHQQKIIHRDIKPGNVLVTAAGTPKLGDFGLAKRLDGDSHTPSQAVFGTPSYMAPELAAGRSKQATPAVDIYSLGATLFALLTGRPPFYGETKLEIIHKVLQEEPPSVRQHRTDVPRALEAICQKCLHKRPEQRYATAELLAQDLESFLAGRPTLARPPRLPARVGHWLKRRPVVLLLGLVLILGVTVPTVAAIVGQRNDWEQQPSGEVDPNQAVLALQQDMADGKTVTLVGAENKLGWHRWRGTPGSRRDPQPGAGIAFESQTLCLLELLPDPGVEQFSLSALVRHEWPVDKNTAEVGIFFGANSVETPAGPTLVFNGLLFNDLCKLDVNYPPALRNGNPLQLSFLGRQGSEAAGNFVPLRRGGTLFQFRPDLQGQGKGVWRSLKLEVRQDKIGVFWDGKQVAAPSTAVFRKNAVQEMRVQWPGMNLRAEDLRLRGGIGVFLQEALATFKQVQVKAL
jgi:serine/threonine-protein kinase